MLWIKCFMSLQNSYVEALTPSVAIYGDGASKEGLKVKQGQGGALIDHLTSLLRAPQKSSYCSQKTHILAWSAPHLHLHSVLQPHELSFLQFLGEAILPPNG